MPKQSGLGDNLYVNGVDVSGDVGSLGRVGGSMEVLDVTAINKSAFERLGGVRDGSIEFSGFFNDAPLQLHQTLRGLPTSDVQVAYFRGTAVGNQAAVCIAKQANYDPTRGTDGSLTVAVQALANGYGLEWGQQLTPGKVTIGAAGNQPSIDTGGASAFGAQAYLQVLGFTGTSATVAVQDSADNSAFAAVTGLTFAAATATGTQRLETARNATIRRYLRASVSGTFSSLTFAVVVVPNEALVLF